MPIATEPPLVLLEASPLDNGHATRGIGRYAAGVVRGLSEIGATNVVQLRQRPVDSDRCLVPSRPWPDSNVPWRQAFHLQRSLGKLLERSGAKILHMMDPLPVPAPRRGVAVCATVHDLIPLLVPEHAVRWGDELGVARWHYHRVFLERLKRADALVTDSYAVRDDVVRHLGIPAERIRVIHLGADDAPLQEGAVSDAERKLLEDCGSRPFFVFSGAAERRKNLDRVLEALAGTDLPHRLVVAGKPGQSNRDRLESLARRLGCPDRLVFTGFLSDQALSELYRRAQALAFASLAEGFGLPLLEAMRHGCPVLTSRGACLEEVAGGAALLVDPTSVDDVRDGLRRLAGDEALRVRLREAGDKRWREFTWVRCAREMQEFWRAVA